MQVIINSEKICLQTTMFDSKDLMLTKLTSLLLSKCENENMEIKVISVSHTEHILFGHENTYIWRDNKLINKYPALDIF